MYKEDVLLTVNEEYKIKLWHIMNNNERLKSINYIIKKIVCKKTCLGPTYGGAINKLLVLNPNDTSNDY